MKHVHKVWDPLLEDKYSNNQKCALKALRILSQSKCWHCYMEKIGDPNFVDEYKLMATLFLSGTV